MPSSSGVCGGRPRGEICRLGGGRGGMGKREVGKRLREEQGEREEGRVKEKG